MTESPEPPDLKAHENKWMRFIEVDKPDRKTRVVACVNRRSGRLIAYLAWYGPWRQYCLYPEPQTVFNTSCIESITAALKTLTEGRKAR